MPTLFDMYDDVMCKMSLVNLKYDEEKKKILEPVQQALDDVEQRRQEELTELVPMKENCEKGLRLQCLEAKSTIQSEHWQVQFVQSQIKVEDLKGLVMFAKQQPDVLKFMKETQPSTRIVARG